MSKVCQLTGKRPIVGNKVSKSNRKVKRRFYPNLFKRKFFVPELNQTIELKITAAALRTINKKGIYAYLKSLEKEGHKVV